MLTLCVFEGTSLHCTVKLIPDRSVPCTQHRVTLYGDTCSGKTGSEHSIGTGKACSPGAGSQTAPGLGGGEFWIMGGHAGELCCRCWRDGGMAAVREAARMKHVFDAFLSRISQLGFFWSLA